MPYSSVSEVPDHVPKAKRKQWMEVWNSVYDKTGDEGRAFAAANGVIKNESEDKSMKVLAGATDVKYTSHASVASETCSRCLHFDPNGNHCGGVEVAKDPNVPEDALGQKVVAPGGWCTQFELQPQPVTGGDGTVKSVRGTGKSMSASPKFKKFIPFAKVDAAKREVWGIVTAEVPDKEDEVCDYTKSKPYYKAVIDEMAKATNGNNFFPLREMHQLSAVGKCIGFEFRDVDKEIFMGFKVVDDEAWKKVEENVYTGFSQGGRKVGDVTPDPVYKGCMRYVADPSEASLVDNPCLGVAHFTYVKADGSVEMRKIRNTEEAAVVPLTRLEALIQKAVYAAGAKALAAVVKSKTKRVAGEDLPSSAFAYVGDPEKTDTWKLPIKFSTDEKTASHIRNALARFSSTQGIPDGEKDKVHARIVAAAKQHGIDVAEEKALISQIQKALRTAARVHVNRILRAAEYGTRGTQTALAKLRPSVQGLDDDLGRLRKGMWEVSRLAECVNEISYMVYAVANEQHWEGDEDSPLPEMIAGNVNSLIDTLLAMVKEETDELREEISLRLKAEGSVGGAVEAY